MLAISIASSTDVDMVDVSHTSFTTSYSTHPEDSVEQSARYSDFHTIGCETDAQIVSQADCPEMEWHYHGETQLCLV